MKNKKGVIAAAGIIAALLIGILVVSNIDTEEKEPRENIPQTNAVYKADISDLSEILIETENSSLKAYSGENNEWLIDGLDKSEVDASKVGALAGTVSSVISKNRFDANGDYAQYGLDDPSVKVTVTKKNGEKNVLNIGDMSPALGEYFIRVDDDESVYTLYAYKVDTLLKPREYYTEFDRFKVNVDDITGVRIGRENGNIEIRLMDTDKQTMANVWEMTEPYNSLANDDYIDNKILAPIENISLANPVKMEVQAPVTLTITVKPYDTTTGKYGEEYTETLLIGETRDNMTYVVYNGETYATPAESVAFAKESAFNIVSKLQAFADISSVKSVTVEYGGEKHTIGISKDSVNTYAFTLDGWETETDAAQEIYRNIIGLAVDGVYDGAPMGDTLLTVTFSGIKSGGDTVIEIKQLDDINCAMVRNNAAEFTIRRNKIDEFTALFDVFVNAAWEGAK